MTKTKQGKVNRVFFRYDIKVFGNNYDHIGVTRKLLLMVCTVANDISLCCLVCGVLAPGQMLPVQRTPLLILYQNICCSVLLCNTTIKEAVADTALMQSTTATRYECCDYFVVDTCTYMGTVNNNSMY